MSFESKHFFFTLFNFGMKKFEFKVFKEREMIPDIIHLLVPRAENLF